MGSNQRDAIKLSPTEITEYLEQSKTLTLATNGRDGWPHLIAMWYAVKDGTILMTTYGKSQKAVNIKRDPRATIMIESELEYSKLKGLMMRGRARIVEDVNFTAEVMRLVGAKMSGGSLRAGPNEAIMTQAPRRVVIEFCPEKTASWDHSKMRRA
jgi:PPOX class probable F420-dependent enzyme